MLSKIFSSLSHLVDEFRSEGTGNGITLWVIKDIEDKINFINIKYDERERETKLSQSRIEAISGWTCRRSKRMGIKISFRGKRVWKYEEVEVEVTNNKKSTEENGETDNLGIKMSSIKPQCNTQHTSKLLTSLTLFLPSFLPHLLLFPLLSHSHCALPLPGIVLGTGFLLCPKPLQLVSQEDSLWWEGGVLETEDPPVAHLHNNVKWWGGRKKYWKKDFKDEIQPV